MIKFFFAVLLTIISLGVSAGSIVVLGDSISAGYGIDVDRGWVRLLQKKLNQQNHSYIVYNESISGDTSAGGLARIDRALRDYKPAIVLLELGANDGLRGLSPKRMKANLAEIIRRCRRNDARVLLLPMRIPPNYGKRYVDMFYRVYPQLAAELNIPFVPFILQEVALQKPLMQKDGLHPNELAQPIIAEKIWKYLQPMLN